MAVKKASAKKSAVPAAPSADPLVKAQPASTTAAAVSAGLFLHTDDAWATAYFSDSDLHGLERKLFG